MAKATKAASLKTAFTNHLEETKGQVERLKQVLQILGKKPLKKSEQDQAASAPALSKKQYVNQPHKKSPPGWRGFLF